MARANRYIGGDEWTKPRITKSIFENQNSIVTDLILRTAKIVHNRTHKVGTAFLFKETSESYIFLTNYHVLKGSRECRNARILLVDENFKRHTLKCHKIIKEGKISDGTDYTYFSIKKESKSDFLMKLGSLPLAKEKPIAGDRLVTVGFGNSKATTRKYDASLGYDDDCLYLLGNKNILLKGELVKDVFFTGCDVISGDSGSAIVNRDTGELVGLLFGAAEQKRSNPLSTSEINEFLGTSYLDFMTNSSLAIDIRSIAL